VSPSCFGTSQFVRARQRPTTGHRNTRALVEHYLREFETRLERSTDSPV
jgi:hypothetical protein